MVDGSVFSFFMLVGHLTLVSTQTGMQCETLMYDWPPVVKIKHSDRSMNLYTGLYAGCARGAKWSTILDLFCQSQFEMEHK